MLKRVLMFWNSYWNIEYCEGYDVWNSLQNNNRENWVWVGMKQDWLWFDRSLLRLGDGNIGVHYTLSTFFVLILYNKKFKKIKGREIKGKNKWIYSSWLVSTLSGLHMTVWLLWWPLTPDWIGLYLGLGFLALCTSPPEHQQKVVLSFQPPEGGFLPPPISIYLKLYSSVLSLQIPHFY